MASAAPLFIKQHQQALRKFSEANLLKETDTRQPPAGQANGLLNKQSANVANQPGAVGPTPPPIGGGQPTATGTLQAQQAPKKLIRKMPKPPERAQRALFCLDLKNPIRKKCIQIVEWKYPFHLTHSIVIMLLLFFFIIISFLSTYLFIFFTLYIGYK